MNSLINIVLMQLNWFACVLGAAKQMPWLGVGVSIAVASWHLLRCAQPWREIQLMLAAVILGFALDSALTTAGVISFTAGTLITGFTTPWMLGLWLGFATTLNSSLRWLMSRPAIAVLFGAIGGPLAYWSGAKLGAITLTNTISSVIFISLEWALGMAALVLVVRFVEHQSPRQVSA
ncbi:MAG TPA: DUF2878 domain-containing protein [Steroidobacteraceae bacterium]|nr:DUF2878 domain-containing protein [Steroidobacteraceae bacterium]